ncbi:MAG TPA: MFS transporter [Bacteroidales bacterium]
MKNRTINKLLPVLFGFFIMGFVDVVGIATNYVKKDFVLTDTLANLLPMMVFLWFFVFSIPTGLLMNKIGRRKTVILSGIITAVAMFIPLIVYQFSVILVAFALLGIGNTILQVSLNPLLTNVVSGERLTSSLTLGQFIKAIASFLGPIIAAWAAASLGNWKYIFPIFAVVTILSTLWLLLTPIEEEAPVGKTSSFAECIRLLGDPTILLFFLGILFVVGVDVGLNTTIPKYLQERCGLSLENAGFGTSLYFVARTAGAFLGAIILAKMNGKIFFIINIIIALAATSLLLFIGELWTIRVLIFVIGFTVANVFSIIFSAALKHKPDNYNEISGLMIMGVSGGAFITFVVGVVSDAFGSQNGGLLVLLVALAYLLFCSLKMKKA